MAVSGWHYDGVTAARRSVTVEVRGARLAIFAEGLEPQLVEPELLRPVEKRRDAEVYALDDVEGWRLGLTEIDDALVEARLPEFEIYGSTIDRIGLPKFLAVAGAISAAVIALFWLAPGWLAPLVPVETERALGDALFADMKGVDLCGVDDAASRAEGLAALNALATRLAPDTPIDLGVVGFDMVNAVTLPGGRILVFDGLIQNAEGPDELAGVLAHEIAHYQERHVMAAMIRELGFSLILTTVGGSAGTSINDLTSLSFSRSAEREADAVAIAMLDDADISPAPTAAFFRGLQADEEDMMGDMATMASFVSTHPASEGRADRFAAAIDEDRDYAPAMTAAEWETVQALCK